jgi:hypothetical protein
MRLRTTTWRRVRAGRLKLQGSLRRRRTRGGLCANATTRLGRRESVGENRDPRLGPRTPWHP